VKALIICLIIWILIVPCVIAIWLILAFVGAFKPSFYLALTGLAAALATLALSRGLFWISQSSTDDSSSASTNRSQSPLRS